MFDISISTICFSKSNNNLIQNIKNFNFSKIELAPTMISYRLKKNEMLSFKKQILKNKIKVVAIQSLFYGKKINIEDKDFKNKFNSHMKKISSICKMFSCDQINLGSPSIRMISNSPNRRKFENKFIGSVKKFLKQNSNLKINLEPILSQKKDKYILQSYSDCIKIVKKSNLKNLRILYDFKLADFYKLKLKNKDIKKKLYGHVHINNIKLNDKSFKNAKDIFQKFISNSYSGEFSIEIIPNNTNNNSIKKFKEINAKLSS
tara:strand:+ start:139 stop:921 length:783 start_codon:yes stop_codon:yes gene_type:complete